MPKLVAHGPGNEEGSFIVRADRQIRLGRQPTGGKSIDPFTIAWETSLSRNHADLRWAEGKLEVSRVSGSKNPVFFKGTARERFSMELGEHFVIGTTTFSLIEDRVDVGHEDPTPLETVSFTMAEIKSTRYRDADDRIAVLASIPEVLRRASSDEDLFSRLVLLLLEGIAAAQAVGIVRVVPDTEAIEIFHWDTRKAGPELKPSQRLILEAIKDRRQSVRSIWGGAADRSPAYTMADAIDWAYCTPVPGAACAGWGIYVVGTAGDTGFDLRPDVKFTELVADLLGAMRDFQSLERQQTALGRFFSPVTLPILASPEGEKALEPRQTEVTVLFCDLRGFSREAERSRDDLMGLLHRVSRALDVMTKCIHSHRGVIGDFQGDAALAFWGWPLDDETDALEACRAAVEIRQRFANAAERKGDPLSGFRCGIGIATGEAVAGRLGTAGQFKIDVFGPVVNLASRLEGFTKTLRVPILVDERTVERLCEGDVRFRRLVRVKPYGMDRPVTVSELLPKGEEPNLLNEASVRQYEKALDAFVEGRWDESFTLLHEVPPWDHGKDFLTSYILKFQRQPPPGWDGVIALTSK
ncbi:MAG TPA: adenylate/guanylate cyclase domain-containing protein [Vicinamibacteria bacterium]|nr:adenylate/guanylate cyclase domain-containing protein [Vicinamibacteria bacterium]